MRFLADENFPRPIVELLQKHGHYVDWARNLYPGVGDRALIEHAEADGLLILTLDKDFWQLALQRRDTLRLRAERAWIGHVSVVTKDGIEMIRRS